MTGNPDTGPAPRHGRAAFWAWFKAGNPDIDPLLFGLTFAVLIAVWAWFDPVWYALNWVIFSALANSGRVPAGLQGLQGMLGGVIFICFVSMSRTRNWRGWQWACVFGLALCILFGSIMAVMHLLLGLPDPRDLADLPEEAQHAANASIFILFPALVLTGMAVSLVAPWWLDGRLPPGGAEQPPKTEWWVHGGLFAGLPLAAGLVVLEAAVTGGRCYPSMGPFMLGMWYPLSAVLCMRAAWLRRPDLRWAMAARCGLGLLILAGGVLLAQFALGCREAGLDRLPGGFSMAAGLGPGLPIHLAAYLLAVWQLHLFMARNGLLAQSHAGAPEPAGPEARA